MEDQTTSPKLTQEDIAAHAYRLWQEDGEPADKAEDHWYRAEEQLRDWHAPEPPEGEAGLPPSA